MNAAQKAELIAKAIGALPPAEQTKALDVLCGQAIELKPLVLSFLGRLAPPGSGDAPPIDTTGPTAEALPRANPAPPVDPTADHPRVARLPLPERIGNYRILKQLGEGGFGVVYLAASDAGLREQVALKLLRPGPASENAIRRFHRERALLARLHHPNIAAFLNADTTPEGAPYFVLEYVAGLTLLEHCDRNGLTVSERLELFVQVCEAVQHAHDRGVMHLDLKPLNIIVDGKGVPKLLDFGIAHLVSRDAEAAAGLQTVGDESVLTPDYASPEQLRGDVTTVQSDVYSLGVILYELLTGQRPYTLSNKIMKAAAAFVDATQVVAPSAKITTIVAGERTGTTKVAADRGQLSARFGTPADRLRRQLSGDIDNIVLVAMRKEPIRRYRSPREIVDDIRRHQRSEPVFARADSKSYRAARFVRRHWLPLTTSSAIIAGTIGTLWFALDAKTSKLAHAESLSRTAQNILSDNAFSKPSGTTGSFEDRRSRAVAAALTLSELDHAAQSPELGDVLNKTVAVFNERITRASKGTQTEQRTAREAADRAVEHWDAMFAADELDPVVRLGLATALQQRAALLFSVGSLERARQDAIDGLAVLDAPAVLQQIEFSVPTAKQNARLHLELARIQYELKKDGESPEGAMLAAERMLRTDGGTLDRDDERTELYAQLLALRGLLAEKGPEPHSALRDYREALALRKQLCQDNPKDYRRRKDYLEALQRTSRTYRTLGDFASADALLKEFEDLVAQPTLGPDAVMILSDRSRGYEQRGHLAAKQGHFDDAVAAHTLAIEALQSAQHSSLEVDTALVDREASISVAKGESLLDAGNYGEASKAYAHAIDQLEKYPPTPDEPDRVLRITALLATAWAGTARAEALASATGSGGSLDTTTTRATQAALAEWTKVVPTRASDARLNEMVIVAEAALVSTRAALAGDADALKKQLEDARSVKSDSADERLERAAGAIALFAERHPDSPTACDCARTALTAVKDRLSAGKPAPRLDLVSNRLEAAIKTVCN